MTVLADTGSDQDVAIDDITAHVCRVIAAADLDLEPTENIYVRDALPASVYAELLARPLPDDAFDYLLHPAIRRADKTSSRLVLDLNDETLLRIAAQDRAIWARLTKAFTHPALFAALKAKFAVTLRARFGNDIPDMVAVPTLYRDYPGYFIPPHPDIDSKVMNLQFYLPHDMSQVHLGTTFHRRGPEGFLELKTNAFLPNSAYGFVRTDESWHSVRTIGPDESARNTLALIFYLKGLPEPKPRPRVQPVPAAPS